MTTLTRPTWLRPRECTLALRKSGLQFVSPFNGTMQAIETLAERWVLSLAMPGAADGGARSAFFNQWAGGVNHVALYHFGRPQPLGTLRGAPTLASATARGNTSLSLTGCINSARQSFTSFETDTNADGLADGAAAYSTGTTGTVTYMRSTSPVVDGAYTQTVNATGIGTNSTDRAGILLARLGVLSGASEIYTVSGYVRGTVGVRGTLLVQFKNSAGTVVDSSSNTVVMSLTNALLTISSTVPSGAVSVDAYLYLADSTVGVTAAFADFDAVLINPGASRADSLGHATLLAGDMLGDGTQLYQVAEDCTATDAGDMTVPVVNRARGVVASGTTLLWDRPTALFALPAMEQSTTWLRGGSVDSMVVDAVEVY